MRLFAVDPVRRLRGKIELPGDKSIAHRAVIVSALAPATTLIENFPANKDCQATISAFRKLGVRISERSENKIVVYGKGLNGLRKPKGPIFFGESGTTIRLLSGVLAGQSFKTKLTAAKSLSKRPMLRVTAPLRLMGAQIQARPQVQYAARNTQYAIQEEYSPLTIKGGNLKGINYKMPVASAQVKSAILFAGLYAEGVTQITEPVPTRDHTERMLKLFKADIRFGSKSNKIILRSPKALISPGSICVPGDISSASFFIVLASILPDAHITVKNVSLNPLRSGILNVLERMGADIKLTAVRQAHHPSNRPERSRGIHSSQLTEAEPMGDLMIRSSKLKGTRVRKGEIPSLIDELPILMVAACYAAGTTVFEGVGELRVKETDRINSMSDNLMRMGADLKVVRLNSREDVIISGPKALKGAKVKTFGDHRTAMSLVVAGLGARKRTELDDIECVRKSFPGFLSVLRSIT